MFKTKGLFLKNNRAFSKFHFCNYSNYRYNFFDWFWLRSYFKMLIFNHFQRTLLWDQTWLKMVDIKSIVLTQPNSVIVITVITGIQWTHFEKARMLQMLLWSNGSCWNDVWSTMCGHCLPVVIFSQVSTPQTNLLF